MDVKVRDMINRLMGAASAAIFLAGSTFAQEITPVSWGDGAAYGGGRFIQGDTLSHPPVKLATPRIATDSVRAPARLSQTPTDECFARISVPATYRTDRRQVVVQDEHTALSFTAPKFGSDVVRVKTQDEYVRYKVRQPRWEVETEEIVTRPAYERLTVRPAQWKFIDETIDISLPKLTWKRGTYQGFDITRTDPVTGTVYTLIEEASEQKTFRKRVMSVPEQVVAQKIPARYTTVTKRILTDPGGVEEETVPAEYSEIDVQTLLEGPVPQQTPVSAKREFIETEIMVSPARWEWKTVVCGEKLNVSLVSHLQTKLNLAGFYKGETDGHLGPQTREALNAFQKSQKLPHGGELTVESLKLLGL